MINTDGATIIVDAHVHIYDCFETGALLDAALGNFTQAAQNRGLEEVELTAVLLLAETSRDFWFQRTHEKCNQNQHPLAVGHRWEINKTLDRAVLQARKLSEVTGDEKHIFIMAGRQIVTAEGLELLALATNSMFEDGLSISSALDAVREQDSIPVLPWAVGKWLGKRGKLLSALLENETNAGLCLGDNGGRPVFWRSPSHFKLAREKNFHLLPGTDPLPFPNEARRIGSFGFMVNGRLSNTQPSADLKRILRNGTSQTTAYGELETSLRFIANQIRLRVA